jgi:GT2 family glycosyltransferase
VSDGPSVAVVVVNFNSGPLLRDCLDSLTKQTLPPRRVVVVDNASTDDSLSTCGSHPEVEILRMGSNAGFAAANNRGARLAADCDLLALLNPDARAEPGWLDALVRAAERYPDCASFASRMLWSGRPGLLDGVGDAYHVSGRVWREGHRLPESEVAVEDREVFSACAAAAAYRRAAWEEAGGFDEGFFCYLEDVDLGFRLRLLGHRCRLVPEAVVHHAGGAIGGTHSDFAVYHGHRNLVWAFVKNMPWPEFGLYLPQHLALNLVSLVWFASRGQGSVVLRAKWAALRGLPRVFRLRRAVQQARRASSASLREAFSRGVLKPYLVSDGRAAP